MNLRHVQLVSDLIKGLYNEINNLRLIHFSVTIEASDHSEFKISSTLHLICFDWSQSILVKGGKNYFSCFKSY